MDNMNTFLKVCYLEKPLHFEVLKVINTLKAGTEVEIILEPDDDGKKIIVAKVNDNRIGMLSDEDAKDIKPYLVSGWDKGELYDCQISRYDEKAPENKMLSIAIYVKEYKEERRNEIEAEEPAAPVPAPDE